MHPDLRRFTLQWLRVAATTLVPVVLAAFVSMPLILGKHPGEAGPKTAVMERHMT